MGCYEHIGIWIRVSTEEKASGNKSKGHEKRPDSRPSLLGSKTNIYDGNYRHNFDNRLFVN